MSLGSERVVADIIRGELGLPGTAMPAIIAQIPEALKETGRKIGADPSTRSLLQTDRTNANNKVALDSDGRMSLLTLYDNAHIIKEFIEFGQIYLLGAATFLNSAVDTTADTITLAAPFRLAKGDKVQFTTTGGLPGGLSLSTNYFVKTWDPNTGKFTLAPTAAITSTSDLTSQGSGTHTVTVQETRDFPLQRLAGPQVEQYDRQLDALFRYYYVQGDSLQVLPAGLAGTVAFAVPRYPTTVVDLGGSAETERIFLDTFRNMVNATMKIAA